MSRAHKDLMTRGTLPGCLGF